MKFGQSLPAPAVDIALLVTRLLVGIILMAHGIQKVTVFTLAGAAENFGSMGVPLPFAAAVFAVIAELIGGALLIAGAFTQIAGTLVVLTMAGAYWFAHMVATPLASEGGWELVAALGLIALLLVVIGPGRYSIDALIGKKLQSREGRAAASVAATA